MILGLEKLFYELKKIREEIKEVKALLKYSRNSAVSVLPENIPVTFPMNVRGDMQVLEDYLKTDEKHTDLVRV